MDDTYTYSSLVAKVLFSLLNTGVYRHSTLIVPKKEKLCMRLIKDGKKKQKSSIWNLQNVIKWHRKDVHDLCIDQEN